MDANPFYPEENEDDLEEELEDDGDTPGTDEDESWQNRYRHDQHTEETPAPQRKVDTY